MSRWTPEDLASRIASNPAIRLHRDSNAHNRPVADRVSGSGKATDGQSGRPEPPEARRDRYSEQAGDFGLKIREHMEQLPGQIRLWLPYPPSTNSRLAMVKGRMLKSAESRSYQKLVKEALVGLKPLTGDLEISVTINRPRRRGDIDNVMKNCFDALTGIAFIDDEQIAMLDAKRYDGDYAREYPGLHIQIKQIV